VVLEPKMKHLINIVVPRIAAYWRDVAFNLDFSISAVQIISKKFPNDPVSCCKELFEEWLISSEGIEPKIWSTLLTSLKPIKNLRAAIEEIEKELKHVSNTVAVGIHQDTTGTAVIASYMIINNSVCSYPFICIAM